MRIVPHAEWSVRGHWWLWALVKFVGPKGAAILHHSVTKITGMTEAAAFRDVRTVETVIYNRRLRSRFATIAYNYLIHPNGMIFEGRGTKYRNGANNDTKSTGLGNKATISICMIGNYHPAAGGTDTLTDAQRESLSFLLWELEMDEHLSNRANVQGHSHVAATACPGDSNRAELESIRTAARSYIPLQPGGSDMPYLIDHANGTFEEILPGKGSTFVSNSAMAAIANVECARTGIFRHPAIAALLDDERHETVEEGVAQVIEPFISELQQNLEAAIAVVDIGVVPTADQIVASLLATVKGKL